MVIRFRTAALALSLALALAVSLPSLSQSDLSFPDGGPITGGPVIGLYGAGAGLAMVNWMLQVRPTDYPTPVPTAVPVITPGPTRGPVVTSNPLATPAPGGGVRPTPRPTLHYYPGAAKTPAFGTPVVQKPLPTLIPQFPAKGIRNVPAYHR